LLKRAYEECLRRDPELDEVAVYSAPNAVAAYEKFGYRAKGPEQVVDGIRYVPMALQLRRGVQSGLSGTEPDAH
jgi:hypothetical protein